MSLARLSQCMQFVLELCTLRLQLIAAFQCRNPVLCSHSSRGKFSLYALMFDFTKSQLGFQLRDLHPMHDVLKLTIHNRSGAILAVAAPIAIASPEEHDVGEVNPR